MDRRSPLVRGALVLLRLALAALIALCTAQPFLTVPAAAQPFLILPPSPIWQNTNPGGGGMINAGAAGPTGTLIAATDLSGINVSYDHGNSWTSVGPGQGLTTTHASALAFDPLNGNHILLGTETGIFRSLDGAHHFTQVLAGGYIHAIQLAAANPSIGYAAYHSRYNLADGQVYKTTDRGASWAQVSSNLPAGLRILKLVVSPVNANEVYAISGHARFAAGPQQIFHSLDGGATWARLQGSARDIQGNALDLFSAALADLAISPGDPHALYLTTFGAASVNNGRGATFVSADAGVTWQQTDQKGGVLFVDALRLGLVRRIDPTFQKPWETDSGVYESTDSGHTWLRVSDAASWSRGWHGTLAYDSNADGPVSSFGTDMSNPNAIYWVTSQAVFASFDAGRSFAPLHTRAVGLGWQATGIVDTVPHSIAINPTNPNHVIACFDDLGCWRTLDAGASWLNSNPVDLQMNTWTDTNTTPPTAPGGEAWDVLFDRASSNIVWAIFEGQDRSFILMNTNGGAADSWKDASAGLPTTKQLFGLSMAATSPTSRTLFVTAAGAIYRNLDAGVSWARSGADTCADCRVTAVDRFNTGLVYAGGESSLRVSTDGGAAWSTINVAGMFDSQISRSISQIVPDPNTTGRVYVAVHGPGAGLWRGTLNAASWQWSKLLNDDFLRSAAVTPGNGQVLYATSSSAFDAGGYDANSHGVLRSTDAGASWTQVNEGMTWPFAIPIAVVPSDPTLVYVGSPGTGIAQRRFVDALPTATATATNTATPTNTPSPTSTSTPTSTPVSLPVLVSPRGATTINPPTFVWDGVPGARSYRLWVNEYATPNVPGKINATYTAQAAGCANGGRCTVSPGVRFAQAGAEWWVTAVMADGSTRMSTSALFSVQAAPTATPTRTATPTATRLPTVTTTPTATRLPTSTPTQVPTPVPASVPVLVSPRGATTINPPTFVWDGVPGARSYRLWVNEYATPNVPGKINATYTAQAAGCTIGGRCTVSPGVRFAQAGAEWWVTAVMADGSTRMSTSALFTMR